MYFDPEKGVFKINDEELLNGEFGAINACRDKTDIGWIPPEFLSAIKDKTITEMRGNLYKADVFALGLVILEAAT